MAFFIKNFENITASLIQAVSQSSSSLTDFNVGSKTRTLLEAFAEELEQFYHLMLRGIIEGIDTAVYNSFDFPPRPAVAASGQLKLSLYVAGTDTPIAPVTPITIPAGTRFQIPVSNSGVVSVASGTIYSTMVDTVWPAGDTSCLVTVACAQSGTLGNTIANTITVPVDTLPVVAGAVYDVTNPLPFVNGEEEEDSASRKLRFAKYLQSLARGTLGACEYGASEAVVKDSSGNIIEQVKSATAVEPFKQDGAKPVGHVDIYIYNGVGGTSQALVDAAQQIVDGYVDADGNRLAGYKAAGIVAKVLAAKEQTQDFVLTTQWLAGYSCDDNAKAAIIGAISRYVASLKPGEPAIFNQVIELVMGVPGMYNMKLTTPSGDVTPQDAQTVIKTGTITIS